MRRSFSHPPVVVVALALLSCAAFAAKDFVMPRAQNAATYALRDVHPMEKVGIAADPYDGQRSELFRAKYGEHGILPVFFVVSNDSDVPVQLSDMRVQMVTSDRTKIEPANEDDIFRRLSRTSHRGDESNRTRTPFPLPRGRPKVGVDKDTAEEIVAAQFNAMAIEPHATRAGFLFFDVGDMDRPRRGARLYVTGLRDGNGQELMFFEVPLEAAP